MRLRTVAAVATKLALAAAIFSQQPHTTPKHAAPPATTEKTAALPVTSVSLYKNGVGFFEHTGHVTGNASVTLSFTSAQLNDVLQSLTAIDLNGGRINGAGYNSTTPLDQQLKNLPLSLAENPSAADFYSAIRGARVLVHSPAGSITGRLLSIEVRSIPTKDGDDTRPGIDHQFLTIVSDTGETRTLELNSATTVSLLDPELRQDVNRYLQLVDSTRNQALRHLTLEDLGTGSRELRVSYISEVPIWKSTYRILFTDPPTNPGAPFVASSATSGIGTTATLQGWSVVDNTTGTDWINVHLSLIAGAPQSFIQPLSQPIYSRRPEVPIAEEAQLSPQTHDSSIDGNDTREQSLYEAMGAAKQRDRFSGGGLESLGTGPMTAQGQGGVMGGVAGYSGALPMAKMMAPPPPPPPPSYQEQASASIAPATTTSNFDDFFAYRLSDPITILKNQSALVPILQSKIGADRVTLVSWRAGSISQPVRALWITNTTGLTLDRGSFALIENGNFGGEGLTEPIHPDERRLLSYAADQAVRVTTEGDNSTSHLTQIRASKGVLNIHRSEVHEVTFVMHNSATDRRTVITEVPVVAGWELDSDPKPEETTPTVYRFRSEVAPGETVRLHVGAKHHGYTTYYLTRSDDNQLTYILNSTDHNSAVETALAPVLEARRHVAEAQSLVNQTDARLTALRSDEERQRANITALQNADKNSRDRFVNDLNHTEDAITAAQTELANRTTALDAAKAELANRIESLQLDETVNPK